CVITGNTAAGDFGGGGINARNTTTVNLLRCQITNNNATDNDGGGLVLYGNFTIDGCTISGNTCGNSGGGVYVELKNRTPELGVVRNSTISGNTTTGGGGGGLYLYVEDNDSILIENCTISGNKATGDAGGVFGNVDGTASVTIRSSTIAFNQAGTDGTGNG